MQDRSLAIDRIKTIVAFTISILTVFSALLGWQMGNVSGEASGEYSAAQRAELNRQKVASINTLIASENQRSFLTYKRYYDEYQLLSSQLRTVEAAETKEEAVIEDLREKQLQLRALYSSNLKLFPNKFITRDGSYDKQVQLGQMWASASRELDLDPEPHRQAGQKLDEQVRNMQVALVLLAVSLFFFAIVSTVESLKYGTLVAFVALGFVFSFFGVGFGAANWKNLYQIPFDFAAQAELPTETVMPSPVVEEATRTPVPTIVPPTPIPETPTPQVPRYFTEEFEQGLAYWSTYLLDKQETPRITAEVDSDVLLESAGGGYLFEIQRSQTGVLSLYEPYEYTDVRMDVRMENLGMSDMSLSLVCRYSSKDGWYEFNISSSGLYDISYAQPSSTGFIAYRTIFNGGSNKIKAGNETNEYGVICQDNTLSLIINGELIRQVTDHLSTSPVGKIGFSVSAVNITPANARLDWIKVSKP